MKRAIKSSQPSTSKDYLMQEKEACQAALDEVSYRLENMKFATGGTLFKELSGLYKNVDKISSYLNEIFNEFYSVESATAVKADDNLPKGYYDDYYGQTAFEEYGDLVSEKCSGMIISKKASEGEEPGGLIYEADRLGIHDFFDLLKCLEGMCYNGTAVEISDYQYRVL